MQWQDIDFEEKVLTPMRSIVKQHIGDVKTEASKKQIPLDDDLVPELLAWRQETPYAGDSDYVFASPKMKGSSPTGCPRLCSSTSSPSLHSLAFH